MKEQERNDYQELAELETVILPEEVMKDMTPEPNIKRYAKAFEDDMDILRGRAATQEGLDTVEETSDFYKEAYFEATKDLQEATKKMVDLTKTVEIQGEKLDDQNKKLDNAIAMLAAADARRPLNMYKRLRENAINQIENIRVKVNDMVTNTRDSLMNVLEKGSIAIAELRKEYHENRKEIYRDHIEDIKDKDDLKVYRKNIDKNDKTVEKYKKQKTKALRKERTQFIEAKMEKDPSLTYKAADRLFQENISSSQGRSREELIEMDSELKDKLLPESTYEERFMEEPDSPVFINTHACLTEINKSDATIREIDDKINAHRERIAERVAQMEARGYNKAPEPKDVSVQLEEAARKLEEVNKTSPSINKDNRDMDR